MYGLREKFDEVMNDDFNTPQVMSIIFDAVKYGNDCLADESIQPAEKAHITNAVKNYILRIADILGLSLKPVKLGNDETEKIEELVGLREKARKSKDYAESDRIRDELLAEGIVVEDTPEGPIWRKS